MDFELAEQLKKAGFPYTRITFVTHSIDDWKSPQLFPTSIATSVAKTLCG